MYLLVILGVILIFAFVGMGFPNGWIVMFLDVPSMLVLLLITLPVLLASGLGKDFMNSFYLFFGKKGQRGLTERKRAVEALDVVIKALRYGGIFATLLQFAVLCNAFEEFDFQKWQASMAVLIIPLIYAYMLILLLLPIRGRLNKDIINYMKDADE